MQAASVQLTEQGFHWLSDQLEEKFLKHGVVPVEDYRHMYWPKIEQSLFSTSFKLGQTYYLNGFFNLSVETIPYFDMGNTEGIIRLKNGEGSLPIRIERNKKTNQTTQPRVYGGAKLRDYFQKYYDGGEKVAVEIIDKRTITIV